MAATHEDRNAQLSPGVAIKAPCRVATTGAITLSTEQTIDGVACVAGDRVLVKDQADQTTNGIYLVSTSAWTREPDFDGNRDVVKGTFVFITNGATNAGAFYECTTANPITFGSSLITFAQGALGPIAIPISATNVTFTPAGAGAVARSVQSKERDWVSVLDFYANGVSGVPVDPTGVVDSTLGIQAAIASVGIGGKVTFPPGTYKTTDEILLYNRNSVILDGSGFTSTVISFSATADATKAVIKIQNSSYCKVRNMQLSSLVGGTKRAGYGVYITSNGAGGPNVTQFNDIEKVWATQLLDAGFQIGHVGTDIDVNVDGNRLVQCFADNCVSGVRVNNTNTNLTEINGGAIATCSTAGIEIGLGARGVRITGPLMYASGSSPIAHILIRRTNSGPISIKDVVAELGNAGTNEPFLVAENASGSVVDYNLLTLDNIICTCNYSNSATKLIDYQGTGSVIMRNCRFGGGASFSGGTGAQLSFQPTNGSSSGQQLLITEGVHLYDGANFNVQTDNGGAWFKWIDIVTMTSGNTDGTATTNTPVFRIRGRVGFENQKLTSITPATGITQSSLGDYGRQTWKVVVDKTAWTAAAVSQDIQFATLPAKTRIVGCYADTTIAYAGLAGTIQLNVFVSAAGDILVQHDVKTAVVTKGLLDADMGTGMTRAALIQGAFIGTNGWPNSNLQPTVRLVSSVGNLGSGTVTNLTTGSTTIYLITETMP